MSTSSPARLAANRANARKSTGPRTPAGKRRSSANALSHGLFARSVVLPTEDPALYDALKDSLVARFNPTGSLEFLLIEKLAICCWKLQRLYRAEAHAHAALANWAPHASRLLKAHQAEDQPFALDDDEEDDDQENDDLRDDATALADPATPRTPSGFPDWPEIERRRAEQRRLAKLQEQSLHLTTDPAATLFCSLMHPLDPLEKLHKLEGQLERSLSRLLRDLRQLQKQNDSRPASDDPEDQLHDLVSLLHNPFLSISTPNLGDENDENEPNTCGTGDPPVASPPPPNDQNDQNEPTAHAPSAHGAASAPSAPLRFNPTLPNEPTTLDSPPSLTKLSPQTDPLPTKDG